MSRKIDLRVIKSKTSLYKGLFTIMAKKKYDDIRVSDICKISNVNRSTFYDHFADKYKLYDSFCSDLKDGLVDSVDGKKRNYTVKEYFLEAALVILSEIDNRKENFTMALDNNYVIIRNLLLFVIGNTVLDYVNRTYKNDSNINTDVVIKFYVSGVVDTMLNAIKDNKFNKSYLGGQLKLIIPELEIFSQK